MKLSVHIIAIAVAILLPVSAMAQRSIESAISNIEKSKSVTHEIYQERRDPGSKDIIHSSRILSFTDKRLADTVIEAIRRERDKATSFQMDTSRGRAVYQISFENRKDLCYDYSLMQKGSNSWVLVIEKRNPAKRNVKTGKRSSSAIDFIDNDFDFDINVDDSNLTYYISPYGKSVFTTIFTSSDDDTDCRKTIRHKQTVEARMQAAEARRQAAEARKQAAESRRQAAKARKQAADTRRQANKIRIKSNSVSRSQSISSSNGDTTINIIEYSI